MSEEKMQNLDLKTIQGINFLKKKCIKESNTLLSEVIIYSEELKLAGTIDLMIFNKDKNHISIIDWKTNKRIKNTLLFFFSSRTTQISHHFIYIYM